MWAFPRIHGTAGPGKSAKLIGRNSQIWPEIVVRLIDIGTVFVFTNALAHELTNPFSQLGKIAKFIILVAHFPALRAASKKRHKCIPVQLSGKVHIIVVNQPVSPAELQQ